MLLGPSGLAAIFPGGSALDLPGDRHVGRRAGRGLPARPAAAHVRRRCGDAQAAAAQRGTHGRPDRRRSAWSCRSRRGWVWSPPWATRNFIGPAGNNAALILVFGMAVAVTSIPVISRIMHDVGLLGTRFSRIVLSVAVIEDIVLYVILAVAIGLVQDSGSEAFGVPAALNIHGVAQNSVYHTIVAVLFLARGAQLRRPGLQGADRDAGQLAGPPEPGCIPAALDARAVGGRAGPRPGPAVRRVRCRDRRSGRHDGVIVRSDRNALGRRSRSGSSSRSTSRSSASNSI